MSNKLNENIKNWLGYGTEDAKIWFLGMEEGGAEISDWGNGSTGRNWSTENLNLIQSLKIREGFNDPLMDFNEVWFDKYQVPKESIKGSTVWRYMAAFDMMFYNSSLNIDEVSNKELQSFLENSIKKYGLIELFPLPCPSKDDQKWFDVYRNCELIPNNWRIAAKGSRNHKEGRQKYQEELIEDRLSLIFDQIKNSEVRYIIDYGAKPEKILGYKNKYQKKFNNYFEPFEYDTQSRNKINSISKECFEHKIKLKDSNRTISIIETPFFGNGQMSYDAMKELVKYII